MSIRKRLGYFVLFCLGSVFVVYKYKGILFSSLRGELGRCNLRWVVFAAVCHLINHSLRAYRWGLLLRANAPKIRFRNVLLAEMNGFCMTMAFNRLGEIVRCRSLKKLEGTKINVSLGSVVVERSLDLFFFMVIVLVFGNLHKGIGRHMWEVVPFGRIAGASSYRVIVGGSLFLLLFLFLLCRFFFYKKPLWNSVVEEIFSFFKVLRELFLSIWSSHGGMVWLTTVLIWFFHFLVEYLTFFAFPETALLDIKKGFLVFLIANVGMALPIPGGMGVYEVLMSEALKKLGIPGVTALAYALITHAVQVFNAFAVGGLCSLFILLSPAHQVPKPTEEESISDPF